MEELNDITLRFSPESLNLLNLCLAIIMFSVALHLKLDNLKYILKNPLSVVLGLISQLVLLPLLTVGLILLLEPPTSVAMGMLLLAACPGGNVSNFFSLIGKGNIALSIALTSISSLVSAFTTPLLFVFWATTLLPADDVHDFHLPFLPALGMILLIIVLPAFLGVLFNHRFSKLAERIKKPMQVIAFLLLIGFIVVALKANIDHFINFVGLVFFLVLAHNFLAFVMGIGLGSVFKRPWQDRITIGLETSIQNTALGLVIVFNFFDGNGPMSMILAWWGVWHLISGYGYALLGKGLLKSVAPNEIH
ncbi:MAG: bile acid:sodium symporter family protein [Flavobacteriales bacterium]|nr:bile acid:sodium symporter family protein [Flavobacteriales bacterium]MDG2245678.1 bile acid:sodium symporter family protein [Flavobacteriales bacterium]